MSAETQIPVQTAEPAPIEETMSTSGPLEAGVSLWNGDDLPATANVSLIVSSASASDASSSENSSKLAVSSPVKVQASLAMSRSYVEQAVKSYFADIPIMIKIAECESQFRQYDSNGEVLRGKVNDMDRGVMQINETYHEAKATSLGYDIMTLQGNMEYARYLYDHQGTRPWLSSSACWANSDATQVATNEK